MAFLGDLSHVPALQMQRADEREVENNAGGFTYAVDDRTRLDCFLTIGTSSASRIRELGAIARKDSLCRAPGSSILGRAWGITSVFSPRPKALRPTALVMRLPRDPAQVEGIAPGRCLQTPKTTGRRTNSCITSR